MPWILNKCHEFCTRLHESFNRLLYVNLTYAVNPLTEDMNNLKDDMNNLTDDVTDDQFLAEITMNWIG